MTARQFLLNESLYYRRKADGCADPFIAVELRRLAEAFEKNADAPRPHSVSVTWPCHPELATACAGEQTETL